MKMKETTLLIRLIRYWFKCLWYYVLFPIGAQEDDFTKQFKNKKITKNNFTTQKTTTKNKWLYTKDSFGKMEKGVANDE